MKLTGIHRGRMELFVAALRSGDYRQAKHKLAVDGGYCCLGVACEVAIANGVAVRTSPVSLPVAGSYMSYDGDTGVLPPSVQEWLGVRANPYIGSDVATSWNDNREASFAEIAALIRGEFGIRKAA